ncbi:hypothetical protein ICN84_00545 [Akkermansia glycaniphila]|uniref:hypothetical protein n=1 Tax=Akkermansia glycaniphila TaxID=1679444 RepID=UPI001C022A1B|nr:hypothetical protein [Akkermansia glycaniphila]MBT9448559.1 hypothetical protein [Akkermansia glycaniphila]
MPSFSLTKTYLDCQTDNGTTIVCYASMLSLGHLKFRHASWLELLPDGTSKRRQTFIRGAMPENTEQGNILWQCRSLHAAGTWRPEHPSLPLQHLHTERGLTTDWHCLQPRSRVSLRLENRHYEGIGYAERLHMTLPPWKLPIDTLHWGRFLGDKGSTIIWIVWEGPSPVTLLWDTQWRHHPAGLHASADGSSLRTDTLRLDFDRRHILREGAIGSTVLRTFPALAKKLLPPSILHLHECKWAGRATLTTSSGTETGLSIHEIVRFSPPSAS